MNRRHFLALLGLELTPPDHREKLLSAATAFVALASVIFITSILTPALAAPVIASMGASAVLLFAAPHGPLSQPWPLLAGHTLSAIAGVTCQLLFPHHPALAAPLAVAISTALMYYTRSIHPPGGATALTAVLAGPAVHGLGYGYVLTPVLLNATLICCAAVVLNYPFTRRRYPAALAPRREPLPSITITAATPPITHADLAHALTHMGSLIDVRPDDLAELYALAVHHARGTHLIPSDIRIGRAYSNTPDPTDPRYAVRQVVDDLPGATPADDLVLYWTLTAANSAAPRPVAVCPRAAFALWAHAEVPLPANPTQLHTTLPPTSSVVYSR